MIYPSLVISSDDSTLYFTVRVNATAVGALWKQVINRTPPYSAIPNIECIPLRMTNIDFMLMFSDTEFYIVGQGNGNIASMRRVSFTMTQTEVWSK